MKEKGWLEITAENYPSPSVDEASVLSNLVTTLVAKLHVPGGRCFSQVLEGNQIVEAKIFLSVFRRLETVLKYVREGRVSIGD